MPTLHKKTSDAKIGELLAEEPSLLDTPTLAVQSISKDVEDELKLQFSKFSTSHDKEIESDQPEHINTAERDLEPREGVLHLKKHEYTTLKRLLVNPDKDSNQQSPQPANRNEVCIETGESLDKNGGSPPLGILDINAIKAAHYDQISSPRSYLFHMGTLY